MWWPVSFDEEWGMTQVDSLSTFPFSSKSSLWDFDIDTNEAISASETFYYWICLRMKIKDTFRILTPFNIELTWILCSSMFFPFFQLFQRWWTLWCCLHILKIASPRIISLYCHIILYSRSHDSRFTNEGTNVLAFSTRQALRGSADPMVPGSLVFIIYYWFKNICCLFLCVCQNSALWGRHRYTEHIRACLLCSGVTSRQ